MAASFQPQALSKVLYRSTYQGVRIVVLISGVVLDMRLRNLLVC